jgi:hypothetical protein
MIRLTSLTATLFTVSNSIHELLRLKILGSAIVILSSSKMLSKKFQNMSFIGISSLSEFPLLFFFLSLEFLLTDIKLFFSLFGIRLAAEYSLKPIFNAPFSDIFADESDDPLFAQLLTRMKVVDADGNAEMDEDQLEAASEFRLLSFTST